MKSKIKIPDVEHIRMMRSTGMTEEMAVRKLASMKRAKLPKLKGGGAEPSTAKNLQDDYPYGLRVELDHEGMKKLGMHTMPKVGSKHQIMAHAHVTNASEHESEGDTGPRRSVSMQITHMALSKRKRNNSQGNGLQDQ